MEILIWIFVGGLVGYLAGQARGRVLDGVTLGVLLGPVGWLIMLCSRDVRLRCIDCGGLVVDGARKCQHCGGVIDKQFDIRCPKCGHTGQVRELRMNEQIVCPSCKKSFPAEKARI
jgi:predicted RNA-binding Zn-ribbon protein involved in translation (DUF1610 family)